METQSIIINNTVIISRDSDGYVNATRLCQAGGRKYKHWFENRRTKQYLLAFSTGRNSGQ